MNNMFDSSSPLESLVLNYASFGVFTIVNNLWTWVAVLTAAVSYWRIRTTSFSYKPNDHHHKQPRIDRNSSGSQAQPSANTSVEPQAPSPSPSPSSSPSPSPAHIPALPSLSDVKEVDGIMERSKYTVYYHQEEERESDGEEEVTVVKEWRYNDDEEEEEEDDGGDDVNGISNGEWWERVRIRGDLGWYSYQDLTVVNGNVVMLWEECRRRSRKRVPSRQLMQCCLVAG